MWEHIAGKMCVEADLAEAERHRLLPSAFQLDSETFPRDRFQSRDESAPHGRFFEVEEGTCPNADWTITLLSAARPRTRKVFHQTHTV